MTQALITVCACFIFGLGTGFAWGVLAMWPKGGVNPIKSL